MLQKKSKALWEGTLNKQELKKMVLYVRNGALCPCQQLQNKKDDFLITGRYVGAHYLLTGIHQWDEKNKQLRKLQKLLKSYKFPTFSCVST